MPYNCMPEYGVFPYFCHVNMITIIPTCNSDCIIYAQVYIIYFCILLSQSHIYVQTLRLQDSCLNLTSLQGIYGMGKLGY
jgi:hypothetical protein